MKAVGKNESHSKSEGKLAEACSLWWGGPGGVLGLSPEPALLLQEGLACVTATLSHLKEPSAWGTCLLMPALLQ